MQIFLVLPHSFPGGNSLIYCLSHREYQWFLGLFGLKMGTDFAHFNPESDMVYEGAIRECIKVSLDLIPNKKERKSNM